MTDRTTPKREPLMVETADTMPSLYRIGAVLMRHLPVLILVPLALVALVGLRLLLGSPEYEATSRVLPQVQETAVSRFAGIAAELGISAPASGGETIEFYRSLIESRSVMTAAILSTYSWTDDDGSSRRTGTLLDYYGLTDLPAEEAMSEALRMLERDMAVTIADASGLITVVTRARSPDLAESINRTLLGLVNEYNLRKRQSQARAEREFVETRLEESRDSLLMAERALEEFYTTNRSYESSAQLQFEESRLRRAVDLRQQLVVSLAQSYEQARLDEVRNTPVVTVIDEPEGSAQSTARPLVSLLLAFIGGLALALAVVLWKEYLRRERRNFPDEYSSWRESLRSVRSRARRLSGRNVA